MKLIRKIIFYANIALVLVTLLAYLSPYVNPASFWALSFLGLLFPLLLFLNFIFVFYWLITEWKKSLLSLLCLALGAHYFLLTFSYAGDQAMEGKTFSLASYNMNYAHGVYKEGTYRYDKVKSAEFANFIMKELDADILCGQESNQYIRDLIGKFYPYQHFIKTAGTTIYSRYPIIEKGQIEFGTITNSCVWADVVVHADTFRVYSAHLQSNKISSDAEKLMEEAERDQQVDFINVRTILSKYKNYVGIRAHQALKIHRHMNESPFPVLFAGDLNDPPVSYTHRIIAMDKKDAFVEAGKGLGITYAGKIPLLRIDNIIVSKEVGVQDLQTIRKGYSDHYPVRVVVGNN